MMMISLLLRVMMKRKLQQITWGKKNHSFRMACDLTHCRELSGYGVGLLSSRTRVLFLATTDAFVWGQNAKTLVYLDI